jgi:Uma2 family endonuclease
VGPGQRIRHPRTHRHDAAARPAELRNRDGHPVGKPGTETRTDRQARQRFEATLPWDVPAGAYALHVDARATLTPHPSASREVPLRVTPATALTNRLDDGIVVVVVQEVVVTVDEYFDGEETNRSRELLFGRVREPPSPFPFHQAAVTRLASLLHQHVTDRQAGTVYVAPLDVVLDASRALIVQPDILFLAAGSTVIVENRVMGPPDLVVEVLSSRTRRRDRHAKRAWYGQYGVKEYWIVDPDAVTIEVVSGSSTAGTVFASGDRLRSVILPEFSGPVESLLAA